MTTIARINEDGDLLIRGELIEGAEFERFATLPPDLIKSGSSVYIDNTTNSLRSDGMNSWWFFTGSRFYVDGDFEIDYELLIGSGSRDIANFAFYVNNAGQNSDGFAFRLQTGAENVDGGFFVTTNGTHEAIDATIKAINADTWYRIKLSCVNGVARAIVKEKDTGKQHSDTSCNLPIDAQHPTRGTFGQKHDGAGNSYGSRWKNIRLSSPYKFKFDTNGDLYVDELIERNGVVFQDDFNSLNYTYSNTTVNSISNSILRVTSTNEDPMINMMGIGHFNSNVYRYLVMKYRVISGNPNNGVEFYYTQVGRESLSEAYKVADYNPLIKDGNWHTMFIDCWENPHWKDANVTGWRFDWCRASGVTMEIDYIKLVDSKSVIKIDGNKRLLLQDELIEGVNF